ncbi:hypothetical protein SAMN05421788_1011260 [Filimonas lacunae]|uniref:Lon N-terminal domain-containing protein n=2 Tax=Filimonas lacunae TaxID=477680 RepID=A0A173MR64_9BACT|nr:ATP-dependent protease La domain protein [Filimonas lacunae]SIS79567.1 hypothetical protein SAMN05421788_1011260 [Filimonas lacunae]
MTNFVRIFPLGIVVFPGESLNLHIFEEQYKQLVHECYTEGKPFGIPTVLNNEMLEMGTLVNITEVTKVYEDGRMDIKTRGESVFRILEVVQRVPDKLYSGAIVNHPDNDITQNKYRMAKIMESVHHLHNLLHVSKDFNKPDKELLSYDIAHHTGLSLEEEYEFLQLLSEDQRLEYIKRHLAKVIPIVGGMENLKTRIQLNGHFKELKGFNLDL